MALGKYYTATEENEILDMFKQGATVEEIAEKTGRSVSGIGIKLRRMGLTGSYQREENVFAKELPKEQKETCEQTPKQKGLDDFTVREILRHLIIDRHCRFRVRENNRVAVVVEKEINMSDIING